MATILDNSFMVCSDCMMVVANGDYSGLDLHTEEYAEARKHEIDAGLGELADAGETVVPGDSDRDEEFSWRGCPLCGSMLGGYRFHCVILGR